MNFEKHFLKHISPKDKGTESEHKSVFSNVIPLSSSSAQQQDIPKPKPKPKLQPKPVVFPPPPVVPSPSPVDKMDNMRQMETMEGHIILQFKKEIEKQLTEALKSFRPVKSDDSKVLFLSKIAEMENRLMASQKETLLPLISNKDDTKEITQKIESIEKNILNSENLYLNKIAEMENRLMDSQKETLLPLISNKDDVKEITQKIEGIEKNILNSENLYLNKIAEMGTRLMDAQKETLLPLISNKDDIKEITQKIESIEKNILNSENLYLNKIAEMENRLMDSQKKNEEFIKITEKDRLAASEKQTLKDKIVEERIKELLNDKLDGGNIRELSNKFAQNLEAFYGKMDGNLFKMFEDIKNKFYRSIADIKEQLADEHREGFKELLPAVKTELKLAVKNCFNDERELFKKDMKDVSLKFAGEYEKLDEMQKNALDKVSEIKADFHSTIKEQFGDERESFKKNMKEVSLKFAGEYEKLDEMQRIASDNAFEIKADLQYAIKKHFNDERELFRKEMEDVSLKFMGEYKKLDKVLNRLNSMNIIDDRIKEFLKKMEAVIVEGENSLMNRADIENKKYLLKIKEFCAETSHEMFSVEASSYYLDIFHGKAVGIGENLDHLIKEIDNLRFEPLLGSASITIKRELESLRNNLLKLRDETESFNNLRAKVGQFIVKAPKTTEKK